MMADLLPNHAQAAPAAGALQAPRTPAQAPTLPPRRLYARFMAGLRRPAALYFALLLAGMGPQLPIPFLLSATVDTLTRGGSLQTAAPRILQLLGLSLAGLVLSVLAGFMAARIDSRFRLNARMTVFRALQGAEASFVRRFDVSDVQARVVSDLQSLHCLRPTMVVAAARHLVFLLIFGGILISLSPFIVLYVAGFLPLAAWMFRRLGRRLSALAMQAHVGFATANATILESLHGLREARVNSSAGFHGERLSASLQDSEALQVSAARHSVLMDLSLGLIPIAVTAIIWMAGGQRVHDGAMSIGELLSFMLVLSMLYGPISGLFTFASGAVYEFAALRRVAALVAALPSQLGLQTQATMPLAAAQPGGPRGPVTVELDGVAFRYGKATVFEDLSAVIPAGRLAQISGPNGAGKSTLAALIAGLDVPSAGHIRFKLHRDGAPVSMLGSPRLGYLSQQALVLGDTLRANIVQGRNIPDAQILDAAARLGLQDFLAEWPAGLDTPVKEGGRELSGGKRQKIALLRAVAGRPGLLILDEPENNLDQATLENLKAFLAALKGECTILLISHGTDLHDLVDQAVVLRTLQQTGTQAGTGNSPAHLPAIPA